MRKTYHRSQKNSISTLKKRIRLSKTSFPGRILADAVSYRIALPVVEIIQYWSGDCYPLCPRCGRSLEREYMGFCDPCGQRLNWTVFPFAKVHTFQNNDD